MASEVDRTSDPAHTAPGRTGVVLAAGFGSRLAAAGASSSIKPLIEVGGEPLLNRTLRSLARAGCDRVVIVLGHEAALLQQEIQGFHGGAPELVFAHNPDYRLANGLSVLCARPHVGAEFVLTMADHVLGDELMELVRTHRPPSDGATLCVDYKLDSIFDMDDATKVLEQDGRIRAIGKELPTFNCIDTGVFICTQALMDELQAVYERRGDASLSDGVGALAARGRMHVLDVGDGFWQDVDTPQMLAHAEAVLARRRAE
ncbi:MAG: NTP transferase domain-containing protein [bacterium]